MKNRSIFIGKIFISENKSFIIYHNKIFNIKNHFTLLNRDIIKAFIYFNKKVKIIKIIKRQKNKFTGIVKMINNKIFFIPDDKIFNNKIIIKHINYIDKILNKKLLVSINSHYIKNNYILGKIIKIIGNIGSYDTDIATLIENNGFNMSFNAKTLNEANSITKFIPSSELKSRLDLRNTLTFTIDGEDSKDYDDAFSFKKINNNLYEIGVHIADVTYYVKENSNIDKEAFNRGNSVYLVDRVIPMLPEILSNDICSLKEKEERLCFSMILHMDINAKIHYKWIGKTIIRSDKKFTYDSIQNILDGKNKIYVDELNILNKISSILDDKKYQSGVIKFNNNDIKIILDSYNKPIKINIIKHKQSHILVENFMLLVNKEIALFMRKEKLFIYRHHDTPNKRDINNIVKIANKLGYNININSFKETNYLYNFLLNNTNNINDKRLLYNIILNSMPKAIYTTRKKSHYGLSFKYYTHFTSPIRRYSDIIVHRLLYNYILNNNKLYDKKYYEDKCKHISMQECNSIKIERLSLQYKMAEFMYQYINYSFDGFITGINFYAMYVQIIDNKCEGIISLRDINDDIYIYNKFLFYVKGKNNKKIYRLGDSIKVKVFDVNLNKYQVYFKIIN